MEGVYFGKEKGKKIWQIHDDEIYLLKFISVDYCELPKFKGFQKYTI